MRCLAPVQGRLAGGNPGARIPDNDSVVPDLDLAPHGHAKASMFAQKEIIREPKTLRLGLVAQPEVAQVQMSRFACAGARRGASVGFRQAGASGDSGILQKNWQN